MSSFNRVVVLGNLTRDPEIRSTGTGKQVGRLGLAINERRKVGSDYAEETVFVDVTVWDKTAEIAREYLAKGAPVMVEGRLKTEKWKGSEGEPREKLTIVADRLILLGGKKETQPKRQAAPVATDDEVPF